MEVKEALEWADSALSTYEPDSMHAEARETLKQVPVLCGTPHNIDNVLQTQNLIDNRLKELSHRGQNCHVEIRRLSWNCWRVDVATTANGGNVLGIGRHTYLNAAIDQAFAHAKTQLT